MKRDKICVVVLSVYLSLCLLMTGCDPKEKSAELQVMEQTNRANVEKIEGLQKELQSLKDECKEEVKGITEKYEKQVEGLKKALVEQQRDFEGMEKTIQRLEQEKLKLSNDAVVVIGELKEKLNGRKGGRGGAVPVMQKAGRIVDRACPQCRGSGTNIKKETCPACEGIGRYKKYSPYGSVTWDNCARCSGRGSVTIKENCSMCSGKGRVPLEH